jgi:hypothetical protein
MVGRKKDGEELRDLYRSPSTSLYPEVSGLATWNEICK